MIPDGTYTAVVDRIEDGLATLQLEDDDGPEEFVVYPGQLPEAARHADAVLRVELADGELAEVAYDEAETEARRDQAQDRFDRLSRRPSREDDTEQDG
ncbi:DUF3006 domain-containing protein [Halosimplex amylolyticum]|uniref:DUF3006 domain-containing protein n=1 Tax=Halosimplex amylolyticum TaxID=3396616 RepID=UPI003F570254